MMMGMMVMMMMMKMMMVMIILILRGPEDPILKISGQSLLIQREASKNLGDLKVFVKDNDQPGLIQVSR